MRRVWASATPDGRLSRRTTIATDRVPARMVEAQEEGYEPGRLGARQLRPARVLSAHPSRGSESFSTGIILLLLVVLLWTGEGRGEAWTGVWLTR